MQQSWDTNPSLLTQSPRLNSRLYQRHRTRTHLAAVQRSCSADRRQSKPNATFDVTHGLDARGDTSLLAATWPSTGSDWCLRWLDTRPHQRRGCQASVGLHSDSPNSIAEF